MQTEPASTDTPSSKPIASETNSLTQEIVDSLKNINPARLQSAIHLASGIATNTSEDLVTICEDVVLKRGVARFVMTLPEKLMNVAFKECKISVQNREEAKRAFEGMINDMGMLRFFSEKISLELLRDFSLFMGLTSVDENPKVMDVSDEIMLGGMEDWLKSFPRQLLENWCTDFGLEFLPDVMENVLVEKIMERMFQLEPIIPELPVPFEKEDQDESSETKIGNNSEKDERRGAKRKKENITESETDDNSGTTKKKAQRKI